MLSPDSFVTQSLHRKLLFCSSLVSSGQSTPSDGHTVILTVVYRFSKMAWFIPLPFAKEMAELLLYHVCMYHGLPRNVLSDHGPQFSVQFWEVFCKLLGATVSMSFGYHPECNGLTERLNLELEVGLSCMASQNPTSWSNGLLWLEYTHNT